MTDKAYRSGFVALVGRPNTGKSTLVNALVAEKISIVTPKPQTTRHSIMGVVTRTDYQVIFVDTPGLHRAGGKQINRTMNRAADSSIAGADLAVLLVDARGWTEKDDFALRHVQDSGIPVILAANKIDLVKPRERLLPFLQDCSARGEFAEIVPISARTGKNLDRLLDVIRQRLPEGAELFPESMTTDRGPEFRIAEVIREKLLMALHEEVPYGLAVEVLRLEERDDLLLADVIIWVERQSHCGIVVGRGGENLKRIGRAARLELERILRRPLHLQTRVKVKENWSDNAAALRQLGYEEPR